MFALLAVTLLAQAPATPTEPPPPPHVAAPLPTGVTPASDVDRFAAFVERHLVSIDVEAFGMSIRSGDRTFKLTDDDFPQAFALVPEARALAEQAQRATRTATALQVVGLSASAGGLLLVALGPLTGLVLPLLITGLALSLAALVLVLVAVPFAVTGTTSFFKALEEHNLGLTRLRPPELQRPAG